MQIVNELHKKTLASYIKKASLSASQSAYDAASAISKKGARNVRIGTAAKHARKEEKRRHGVEKAVDKLVKEEVITEMPKDVKATSTIGKKVLKALNVWHKETHKGPMKEELKSEPVKVDMTDWLKKNPKAISHVMKAMKPAGQPKPKAVKEELVNPGSIENMRHAVYACHQGQLGQYTKDGHFWTTPDYMINKIGMAPGGAIVYHVFNHHPNYNGTHVFHLNHTNDGIDINHVDTVQKEETEVIKMATLVELAETKNPMGFKEMIQNILAAKVQEALNLKKVEVAKTFILPEATPGAGSGEEPTGCHTTDSPGGLYDKPGAAYANPGQLHAPNGDPAHTPNHGGIKASGVSVSSMPAPVHASPGIGVFGTTVPSDKKRVTAYKEPSEGGAHTNSGT